MGTGWRLALAAVLLALWSFPTHAADGVVTSVEPAATGQGETVLLTITGETLPQGTLVIEFFPQQIALLDILAASATEIQALVKVAHTAPPGSYNIMVYNQRGEEAFGESLLQVGASVITPVFKTYDPKTIADASSGFALLLTGEYITEASVSHLSIEWEQDGQPVSSLASSFSMGGNRAVVCAVEGAPPPGLLRGRIFLDGVPIYLVEITVEGGSALIIGHTPAQLSAAASSLKLVLLGSELTSIAVGGLAVELTTTALTAKAQRVVLLDSASCEAEFAGPLPAGEYVLDVVSAGSKVYTSTVTLTSEADLVPESDDHETETSSGAEGEVIANGGYIDSYNETDGFEPTHTSPGEQGEENAGLVSSLQIKSVTPNVIDPADKACRFAVETTGLSEGLLSELEPALEVGGMSATLLLSGSSGDQMTCVFSPPPSGWPAGSKGVLALQLPGAELPSATVEVEVKDAASPVLTESPAPSSVGSAPPTPESVWEAVSAEVVGGAGADFLHVLLAGPDETTGLEQLEASYTLLPDELGYADLFSNLALAGKLEMSVEEDGQMLATAGGYFVSGSLMVTLRHAGGTPQLSMLRLEVAAPRISISPPSTGEVRQDVVSGGWLPPVLTWLLNAAPLEFADARFFSLIDANGRVVDSTETIQGSEVSVTCPTGELIASGELRSEIQCALPVELDGESKFEVPVSAPFDGLPAGAAPNETDALPAGVDFAEPRLLICPEGLWVELDYHGLEAALGDWESVEVDASDILLQANIEKFTVEVHAMATQTEEGENRIQLLLRRDGETLSDVAFELLYSQLLERGECRMQLKWPELGVVVADELQVVEDRRLTGTATPGLS